MPRADKEADKVYAKSYHVQNKDMVNQRKREYYAAHREEWLRKQREIYQPRYRTKKNKRAGELNQEQKILVLSHYSGGTLKCAHCGIDDIDVLSLDHVNGGGGQHRKLNPHSYRWAIKENFPEGFQVLCFNCNWKKRLQIKEK